MFIFLTLNWLFLWEISGDTNILEFEDANLIPFFKLSPLIFLILIPAITMRSFSEEKRTGTIELLFTRPISDFKILLSKYLAGVTLVFIALLPTLVYYLSVHLMGDPVGIIDDGATIGSYIGLLLLGSAFVAIGMFTSSFTKSQIVAYIVAVFGCWILFDGLGMLASFEKLGGADFVLEYIGISSHYDSLQKGVIDTKDIVYFLSIILFFLLATGITINRNKGRRVIIFVFATVAFVFLNIISVYTFKRFDLTEDQKYTLSASTITFLEDEEKFEEPVLFKIYLEGELPSALKKARNSIQEKLDQFRIYAGDRIQYEFIDPKAETNDEKQQELEKQLYKEGNGIQPLDYQMMDKGDFSTNIYWPGATATYKGEKVSYLQFISIKQIRANEDLTLMNNYIENNLEYQLVNAIHKIVRTEKKKIGFLQGHGELSSDETQMARAALQENYIVEDIEIDNKIDALVGYDGLIIAQPKTAFNEKDKFVIDQFIMKGGRSMWFINPIEVNIDSLHGRGETYGLTRTLNIQDQLFKYGVRFNNELILQETSSYKYLPVDGRKIWKWPFYINLKPGVHSISQNIDPVKLDYASPIEFVGYDSTSRDTVLLTEEIAEYWKPPVRINLNIAMPELSPFNDWQGNPLKKPVAGLLEGSFTSLYKDRLSQAFIESADYKTLQKSKLTKIFVMGDANFMISHKEITSNKTGESKLFKIFDLRYLHYEQQNIRNPPAYGNLSFFMNTVDHMMDDQSTVGSRNKGVTKRKLSQEEITEFSGFWKIINLVVPLLIITFLTVSLILFKKIKYAKKK